MTTDDGRGEDGVLYGRRVRLRPVRPSDAGRLLELRSTPEVRRWWGTPSDDDATSEDDTVRYVVEVGDRVVGFIQYAEEPDPMYRHAGVDLYLDPQVHGQGLGQDAVRTVARYLFEVLGHHRLVIDPAAANTKAISTYSAVGFRAVGVLRAYERDADGSGWHDGLLMDLLRPELT